MKDEIIKILSDIDLEIDEIDFYDSDIIEVSLSMVHRLQTIITNLRNKLQSYIFPTKEDEILFSKNKSPIF